MVDVNCTDKGKRTPLLFALENGFKDVAKLLLEEGADARIANTVVGSYSDTLGDRQKCHCNRLSL